MKIIKFKNVKKYFKRKGLFQEKHEEVKAVDDVSFEVNKGEIFGLVGESGSGKSTIAKLIVDILQPDEGNIEVMSEMDIVFQDPFSSLNPRMKVVDIVGEALLVRGEEKSIIKDKVEQVLRRVKLADPECLEKYPHQFSGGERQRIAIARAIIRNPDILVLDEPVSSLDVSIQAGILNLFKDLQKELDLTYLFISHDLRVVEFMSDTVAVMKDGRIVEVASSKDIYASPKDEYTRHLLDSIPKI